MTTPSRICIGQTQVGPGAPPFIVAELSANHNGRLENALALMEAAKKAGANACKIQTYTADTLTLNSPKTDFQIQEGLWKGRSLYELYEQAYTPWEWHETLFKYARQLEIPLFSSPFDPTAVELLESLGAPAYKIASFELVDLELIRCVAATGKPVILSTGLATEEEIGEAVDVMRKAENSAMILLHCVSSYPARAEDYHLRMVSELARRFQCVSGLSDHTLGTSTSVVAVGLGASFIEKHFTLDREGGGPDDSFSLEPEELSRLCEDTFTAWQSLGTDKYIRSDMEKKNLRFRRSLYVVRDVKKGEVVSDDNVKSIRPGFGLKPKFLPEIRGKTFVKDLPKGTALSHELLA